MADQQIIGFVGIGADGTGHSGQQSSVHFPRRISSDRWNYTRLYGFPAQWRSGSGQPAYGQGLAPGMEAGAEKGMRWGPAQTPKTRL